MATEQALLRDNINSIFVNLSRRSQALVERQLSLIDRLEQDEQDPDQLAVAVRAGPPRHPDAAELGKPPGALRHRPFPAAVPAGARVRRGRRRGVRGRALRPHRGGLRAGRRRPGPRGLRPRARHRRAAGQRHLLLPGGEEGHRPDGDDPQEGARHPDHRPGRRHVRGRDRGHQRPARRPAGPRRRGDQANGSLRGRAPGQAAQHRRAAAGQRGHRGRPDRPDQRAGRAGPADRRRAEVDAVAVHHGLAGRSPNRREHRGAAQPADGAHQRADPQQRHRGRVHRRHAEGAPDGSADGRADPRGDLAGPLGRRGRAATRRSSRRLRAPARARPTNGVPAQPAADPRPSRTAARRATAHRTTPGPSLFGAPMPDSPHRTRTAHRLQRVLAGSTPAGEAT